VCECVYENVSVHVDAYEEIEEAGGIEYEKDEKDYGKKNEEERTEK
jgi:hypothetical protein